MNDFLLAEVCFSENKIFLLVDMNKKSWLFLSVLYRFWKGRGENKKANHWYTNELRVEYHQKTLGL